MDRPPRRLHPSGGRAGRRSAADRSPDRPAGGEHEPSLPGQRRHPANQSGGGDGGRLRGSRATRAEIYGRLARQHDGHLDEVHALRDAAAADIVALLVYYADGTQASWGGALAEYNAFVVYSLTRFTWPVPDDWPNIGRVFAHELGHVMGLSHDRYTLEAAGVDLRGVDPPYGVGYVNQAAFREEGKTCWWTIMAYHAQCADGGVRGPQRLRASALLEPRPDLRGRPARHAWRGGVSEGRGAGGCAKGAEREPADRCELPGVDDTSGEAVHRRPPSGPG